MDVREVDGTCHDTGREACASHMTRAAQTRRESIRAASELFRHSRETEGRAGSLWGDMSLWEGVASVCCDRLT